MFQCDICHKDATYLDLNDFVLLCEKHRTFNVIRLNLEKKKILNIDLDFMVLNNYCVYLNNIDIFNTKMKEFFRYLINDKTNTDNVYILISKDKPESNKFLKEYLDSDMSLGSIPEYLTRSKYSQLYNDELNCIAFNLFAIESGREMMFFIELLCKSYKFENLDKLSSRLYGNFDELLKIYNSRFNINYLLRDNTPEANNILITTELQLFKSYWSYNKIIIKHREETYTYVADLISRMFIGEFKALIKMLYETNNVYSFLEILNELIKIAITSSLNFEENKSNYIESKINNIWYSEFQKYDLLKPYLQEFYNSLKLKLSKQKDLTLDEFYHLIQNEKISTIKKIPLVLLPHELLLLIKEGQSLESEVINIVEPALLPLPNILHFMKKTEDIVRIQFPSSYIYLLLMKRFHIWKSIGISTRQSIYYDEIMKSYRELRDYRYKYGEIIYHDLGQKKSYILNDDILDLTGLAYIYLIYGKNHDLHVTLDRLNDLTNSPDVEITVKMSVYSLNFFSREDYNSLKCIYRTTLDEIAINNEYCEGDDHIIRSLIYFSEGFYEKSLDKKEDLYKNALKTLSEQRIVLETRNRDLVEYLEQKLVYMIFFHIERALYQESIFSKLTIIDNINKIIHSHFSRLKKGGSLYYFKLKTDIIQSYLNKDYKSITELLKELDIFDFDSSKNFKTFIRELLVVDESKDNALSLIKKYKHQDDLWIKFLINVIENKIQDEYKEYIGYKEKITKINTLEDIQGQLLKFRDLIEDGCVRYFWKNKTKKRENPEDVGKSLLYVFLSAMNYIVDQEIPVNFYYLDLKAIRDDKCYLFETKYYWSKKHYEDGFNQIEHKYCKYLKTKYRELKAFYVVFDPRDKKHNLPKRHKMSDGNYIEIIHIRVGRALS